MQGGGGQPPVVLQYSCVVLLMVVLLHAVCDVLIYVPGIQEATSIPFVGPAKNVLSIISS